MHIHTLLALQLLVCQEDTHWLAVLRVIISVAASNSCARQVCSRTVLVCCGSTDCATDAATKSLCCVLSCST